MEEEGPSTMSPLEPNQDSTEKTTYEKWLRKRRNSTFIFAFQNLLIGVDDGLTVTTLWVYIQTMVKPSRPEMFYSLILVSYFVTSMVTSVITARIADRTRNVRLVFLICNSIATCGNLLYTVHFSPWFLVCARILCGFTYPLKSVIIGELTRVYEKEALSSKVAQVSTMFMIGYAAVPCVISLFTKVHANIGYWRIEYGNIPGFIIGTLRITVIILCFFFLHNTSQEYDLKADKVESYEMIDATDMEAGEKGPIPKDPIITEKTALVPHKIEQDALPMETTRTSRWVFRQLMTNWDPALLIITSLIDFMLITSFKMIDPVLIFSVLKWGIGILNAYILGLAVCILVPALIFGCKHFSDRVVYITAVFSYVGFMIVQADYTLAFLYHKNFILNVVLLVIKPIFIANCIIIEEIFIAGFLAKMVSTKYQSFADSIRVASAMMGAIIAECTTMMAYHKIWIAGPCYIAAVFVLLVFIIYRRKTLSCPRIIIH